MTTFGDRFARLLKEIESAFGLDQKRVAEELGKNPQVISDYKAGRSKPSFDVLFMLRKKFGVSIDALLMDEVSARNGAITANDPWITAHLGFIADCRDMDQDIFMSHARVIHGLAEDARKRRRESESAKLG